MVTEEDTPSGTDTSVFLDGDEAARVPFLVAGLTPRRVGASRLWRDGEMDRASMTVRVPAARLDATLAPLSDSSSQLSVAARWRTRSTILCFRIAVSQERSADRPAKLARPLITASKTSCTTSSARAGSCSFRLAKLTR